MAATVRKGIKISGVCLFLLYLTGLVYFLFFAEEYGRSAAVVGYNTRPFREILRYLRYWKILGLRTVILNLAGNVIGFMPFGALLPIFSRQMRRPWKITLLSFEISAIIEISQLVLQVGCFDVDDMILNTLGGLLGYLVFWASNRWYFRLGEFLRGQTNRKKEVKYGKAAGLFF